MDYYIIIFSDSFNTSIIEVKNNLDQVDQLNNTLEENTIDINLLKVSVGGTMFKMDALEDGIGKTTIHQDNLLATSKVYFSYNLCKI